MATLALLLTYALLVPGMVAGLYQIFDPFSHPDELFMMAYFLGFPMGLIVGGLHWLLRRWSGWSSGGLVIGLGVLMAGVAGPLAMALAFLAYGLVFPFVCWLHDRLARVPQ